MARIVNFTGHACADKGARDLNRRKTGNKISFPKKGLLLEDTNSEIKNSLYETYV